MPPPDHTELSAAEVDEILTTLDAVRAELNNTDKITLLMAIEDAAGILIDKILPDDPEENP